MRIRVKASCGSPARRSLVGLCLLLPLLMGGCPEFRDDVVSVFQTATEAALLSTEDAWTIVNATRVSLVDATIDLVFDSLRSNGSP